MIPYRAISVDDEPRAHEVLAILLADSPDVELAATFTSPAAALRRLAAEPFDLLFLDVAMPGLTGLDLLRTLGAPPTTILLTAHPEHALSAFELGVRDYLLKPVSARRLAKCLDQIRPLLEASRAAAGRAPARLAFQCGHRRELIDPTRILRIEAAGNFSAIETGERRIFASESLKDLTERLAPFGFLRVHKSYLVRRGAIRAVSPLELHLEDGSRLPLGRAYRGAVVAALES